MHKEHIQIDLMCEYEKCVLCNEVTDFKRRLPVDARKYYINGIGQLCRQCYVKLNESDTDKKNGRE